MLFSQMDEQKLPDSPQQSFSPEGKATHIQPVNEGWVIEEQADGEFCEGIISLLNSLPTLGATRKQLLDLKHFVVVDNTLF